MSTHPLIGYIWIPKKISSVLFPLRMVFSFNNVLNTFNWMWIGQPWCIPKESEKMIQHVVHPQSRTRSSLRWWLLASTSARSFRRPPGSRTSRRISGDACGSAIGSGWRSWGHWCITWWRDWQRGRLQSMDCCTETWKNLRRTWHDGIWQGSHPMWIEL